MCFVYSPILSDIDLFNSYCLKYQYITWLKGVIEMMNIEAITHFYKNIVCNINKKAWSYVEVLDDFAIYYEDELKTGSLWIKELRVAYMWAVIYLIIKGECSMAEVKLYYKLQDYRLFG